MTENVDTAAAEEARSDQRLALLLAMAMFVFVIDTSLMNVSISAVVRDLDTTVSGVQSAIAIEALVSAAFILIGSKIGELLRPQAGLRPRPAPVRVGRSGDGVRPRPGRDHRTALTSLRSSSVIPNRTHKTHSPSARRPHRLLGCAAMRWQEVPSTVFQLWTRTLPLLCRAWVLALLVVGSMMGLFPVGVAAATEVNPLSSPPKRATPAQLKRRQAVADIQLTKARRGELRQRAASSRSADQLGRALLPAIPPLLGVIVTAFVAYLAIILPLQSQRVRDRRERKRAAEEDVKQRRAAATQETSQQRKELVQRFDVGFAAAVAAIAGPTAAVQAGGAAALQSFLRPDLYEFRDQVYLAVRAHLDLRIDHPDAVRSILVATLETLLGERHRNPTPPSAPRIASVGLPTGINLARTWLRRADLRGLDLASADLWRSDLHDARFDGSSLRRSQGWKSELAGASFRGCDLEEVRFRAARAPGAVFSDARLVSARFEEAILHGAHFRGAKLQSAHFEGAKLCGADFRKADVKDAMFSGAEFDDDALSSLVLSRRLWEAHPSTGKSRFTARFDPDIGDRLRVLAGRRGWNWAAASA